MTRSGAWIARLGLALAAVLVLVAAGEAFLRIAAWRSERGAREAAQAWRAAHPEAADLPELSGVLALARRNVRGIHKGVVVRTDAHGLRGPDRQPRADTGAVRIVVAGDSFTFGSGVAEEDVYASRLGPLLDRARPGRRHEVVNAGLPGAPIGAVVDRLANAIAAYRPGLYVYGFTLNDIEGPAYRVLEDDAASRSWLAWSGRQPLLLVRWATWRLLTMAPPGPPAEQPYPRELHRNYFENPAAWADFAEGLDRFAALTRRDGVCGHVLIHTHLTDLDDRHPFLAVYDRVAEAARARGLGVTRSFDAFAGADPTTLWINPLDSHPNAEGHARLAGALAADLARLPEACWVAAATRSAGGEAPAG